MAKPDCAGSFSMSCEQDQRTSLTLSIALPLAIFGSLALTILITFACFYKKIFQELEARRHARIKARRVHILIS